MPDVISESGTLALFAGDAKCLRTINSDVDYLALQRDLNNLTTWSAEWKLAFNIDKCTISTVTTKRNPVSFTYMK